MEYNPLKRRIMTPQERGQLKADINDREIQVQGSDIVGMRGATEPIWERTNKNTMASFERSKFEIEKRKRLLEEGSVYDLSPEEKKNIEDRIKILEDEVKKKLAPVDFYHKQREDRKDYHKVVSHIAKVEMNPTFVNMTDELKNLKRQIDPDDPNAGNLEYLREG